MKKLLINLIKLYQKTISKVLGNLGVNCKFYPSCSEYTRPSNSKIWSSKRVYIRSEKNL